MASSMMIKVYDRQDVVFEQEFSGVVQLGRQESDHESIYSSRKVDRPNRDNCDWRVVIARLEEDTTSRKHALVELLDNGKAKVANLSNKVPIRLTDNSELPAGQSCEVALPAVLVLGKKSLRVQSMDTREQPIRALPTPATPPGLVSLAASRFPTLLIPNVDPESLIQWLQTTMEVLQAAATSSEFFEKAAQAVVEIVGLDTGRVLLYKDGQWERASLFSRPEVKANPDARPSGEVLNRVRAEKKTCWRNPDQNELEMSSSLVGVELVVAAPILNRSNEVIGAIYGDCRADSPTAHLARVTKLEAMLVELLARSVATGLARIEQEKVAIEAELRFGQFFTRELSRQLTLKPDLLEGRDAEVTILFCDIRAFSTHSKTLGPAGTVQWINDVMGALSDCVLEHNGVLVDYIGDELMAMWGAPETQPDHARLACKAGQAMLNVLPELNKRWQTPLHAPMAIGIGINTGEARVGNTGSRHKFKYGPLGNTVNLASRVQGATKYLRCRLLITDSTRAKLDDEFYTRRVCSVRVINIPDTVKLYELVPHSHPEWEKTREQYERALEEFEQRRFRESVRILGTFLAEHDDDGPALVLMSRATNALVEESARFDPVWDLPGK